MRLSINTFVSNFCYHRKKTKKVIAELKDKVSTLEAVLGSFIRFMQQTEKAIRELKHEMSELKDEMKEFKDESQKSPPSCRMNAATYNPT